MIYRNIDKIADSKLRNAIEKLAENYKFISLYIDPNDEYAVKIEGHLSPKDIKTAMTILGLPVITEDYSPVEIQDYEYMDNYTMIYS